MCSNVSNQVEFSKAVASLMAGSSQQWDRGGDAYVTVPLNRWAADAYQFYAYDAFVFWSVCGAKCLNDPAE